MKFKQYEFSDIAEYITTKVDIANVEQAKYISTDNMLANFGGISIAGNLPATVRCNSFKKRDILFSNIRTYFKKVWLAEFDGGCSADVLVIRSKNEEIVLNEFLYLLICSEEFINFTVASSNGAKMPRGDKNAIKKYVFNIPDIKYQTQCIDKYFNLNKKIQLNTQINQTLEQIAQTIFKSWFIDFDPIHAKANALANGQTAEQATQAAMAVISGKNTQELHRLQTANPKQYQQLWEIAEAFPSGFDEEGVPRGWESKKVGEVVNIVDYVANGSFSDLKDNVTLLSKQDYAIYVRTTDYNSGFSKDLKYVSKSSYDFLSKSVLIGGEVIISNVGDVGTVFRSPVWLNMPMTLGSNAIALKNYDLSNFLYLYFSSYKGQGSISSIVTGSAQLKFNKTNFRNIEIVIPNNKLLLHFEKFMNSLFYKIDSNLGENKNLVKIRDELLPKLLSGEV
ncbi:restriction endonuclease subunit S [Glaesserella parasuis]|nr:restriction endonuclease subunit S [Glaesserella parasuis]